MAGTNSPLFWSSIEVCRLSHWLFKKFKPSSWHVWKAWVLDLNAVSSRYSSHQIISIDEGMHLAAIEKINCWNNVYFWFGGLLGSNFKISCCCCGVAWLIDMRQKLLWLYLNAFGRDCLWIIETWLLFEWFYWYANSVYSENFWVCSGWNFSTAGIVFIEKLSK